MPSPPASGTGNLALRIVAALIMAPLAIGIAWIGGWPWLWLVTLAAALMFFEWLLIVGASNSRILIATGLAPLALAGPLLMTGRVEVAAAVILAGIVALGAMAHGRRLWVAGGLAYAGAAFLASVLLRQDEEFGFVALIFVLLVVWVTDIGGYFAGRAIGGPKLWPRISPKKTWAGAFGALALSLAVALAFAGFGFGNASVLLVLAAMLSVVSQLGDLFESAVKRRFGVKDSSQIIPGHGGLLDRLDGFVAAIIFAALIGLMRGGLDGVGRGFMIW